MHELALKVAPMFGTVRPDHADSESIHVAIVPWRIVQDFYLTIIDVATCILGPQKWPSAALRIELVVWVVSNVKLVILQEFIGANLKLIIVPFQQILDYEDGMLEDGLLKVKAKDQPIIKSSELPVRCLEARFIITWHWLLCHLVN